jgi:hypothetical protein
MPILGSRAYLGAVAAILQTRAGFTACRKPCFREVWREGTTSVVPAIPLIFFPDFFLRLLGPETQISLDHTKSKLL